MLAYNYWASSCGRMRILWYVHIWIDFGVTYHCNKNLEHFVLAIVKYYTDRFPSCHKPIMISFYAWVIPNCTKRSFGQKRFQPRVAFGAYMCTSPDGSTRFVLKGNNPPISSNLAVVKVELGEVVCIDYERDCINQTDTFHGSQDIEVFAYSELLMTTSRIIRSSSLSSFRKDSSRRLKTRLCYLLCWSPAALKDSPLC